MAKTYKTPGVYVEEISTLPPSVAEVSTAVPAFFGYTEKGGSSDGPVVERINTLLEYETLFGGAEPTKFTVATATDSDTGVEQVASITPATPDPKFLMHYAMTHYFMNGGGSCYVVCLGNYAEGKPAKGDFSAGLGLLEKEDEPTILVMTDAIGLGEDDFYQVCGEALDHCGKMRDRFAVLDLRSDDEDAATFRNRVASDYLMFGAAYHPHLSTTIVRRSDDESLVSLAGAAAAEGAAQGTFGGITVTYTGAATEPAVRILVGDATAAVDFEVSADRLTIRNSKDRTGTEIATAWTAWIADSSNDAAGYSVAASAQADQPAPSTSNAFTSLAAGSTLESIRSTNTVVYHQIKAGLAAQRVTLPPSAAIAGVYARVDRDRGVWKAPANVTVSGVIAPALKITNEMQDRLNVDPTAGKSINAIRAFTGKGTLVWGARTLAGNDNEWRYVSVRRLFNMVEESSQKATSFAVFEPNDATTWLKVKGMIESFLYGLWERGAFAGPTPESAYFVDVGLGKTMTTDDILNGRMIVRIGVAAVRPAEFIVLEFTHKLQEA